MEIELYRVLAVIVLLLLTVIRNYMRKRQANPRNLPYPPGPKSLPILGNIYDVPASAPWLRYQQWSERYGDIMFLQVFNQPVVILGSVKAAVDLFEKRSAIYSDRMPSAMVSLMGWDWNIGVMHYGDWWRRNRRAFNQYFNSAATENYTKIQEEQTHKFLKNLLAAPNDFMSLIRLLFASAGFKIMYGIDIEDPSDKYIAVAEESLKALAEGLIPGKYWVDFLPILKHVPSWTPGAGFKRNASRWKVSTTGTKEEPYRAARVEWDADKFNQEFVVAKMLSKLGEPPYYHGGEEIAKNITGVGFAAGVDTSMSTTQSFFFAMAMHPEIQKKAQMELDEVIGANRLPTLADRANLPYIDAITKENLRWQPVLPLGIPHRSIADDEYMGYFIPKGTMVIANQWRMLHDAHIYPDPEQFNPDRFIKDGKLNPLVPEPTAGFGFGRRICPGRFFADKSVFLTIASVLHVFDLSPPLDEHNRPIYSEIKMTSDNSVSLPKPFECVIKPRSAERAALLDQHCV